MKYEAISRFWEPAPTRPTRRGGSPVGNDGLARRGGDTLSNAERQAVAEADEWLKHNQPIPHEEVLAEFGLTMADWEKMGQEPLPGEPPRRNG